jgi:hypothetical protein
LTVELDPPAEVDSGCNLWYQLETAPKTRTVIANLTADVLNIDITRLVANESYSVVATMYSENTKVRSSLSTTPVEANGSEGFWGIADELWYA